MKKITCLICARGGSKGIKNKNIKKFHGKHLIENGLLMLQKASINFQILFYQQTHKKLLK